MLLVQMYTGALNAVIKLKCAHSTSSNADQFLKSFTMRFSGKLVILITEDPIIP